jgi:hypothetical protein
VLVEQLTHEIAHLDGQMATLQAEAAQLPENDPHRANLLAHATRLATQRSLRQELLTHLAEAQAVLAQWQAAPTAAHTQTMLGHYHRLLVHRQPTELLVQHLPTAAPTVYGNCGLCVAQAAQRLGAFLNH